MSTTSLARLQELFRDVLDRPELVLTPQLNASMVEGWDSFTQITLILAIEEEFGIKFALSELENLRDVGQMLKLLDQKVGVR